MTLYIRDIDPYIIFREGWQGRVNVGGSRLLQLPVRDSAAPLFQDSLRSVQGGVQGVADRVE